MAGWINAHPDFELMTQPVLSLFTFRYAPKRAAELDALNAKLVESINADGRIYLTQTQYKGQFIIRFQVGQTNTTRKHVEQAWSVIQEVAAELEKG
jgi:aromatic-L-amino-acid/L-tryptophan decarboxylase